MKSAFIHKKPKTIETTNLSAFHWRLTIFSSGGPFLDGYILAIIGIALVPLTKLWHPNDLWLGLIGASSLIGVFIGGIAFGYLTDLIGRRLMYMVDLSLIVVLSIWQFFANGIIELFILRLLIGVVVGADYPISTALVVEFVPHQWRAKLVGGLNAMWFVGATVASFVGFALLHVQNGWRWMLISSAVPAIIVMIGRLSIPESPRWLLNKGRKDEALEVLHTILGPEATLEDLHEPEQKATLASLFQAGYLKRIFFVGVFWTCTIVTLFAIYAFGPQILTLLHLSGGGLATLGYGLINVFFLVGNIIALLIVDKMGRRAVLIWGFILSGLGLLFLGLFPNASVFAVGIAFAVYAIFNGGPSILEWIYPNELFPTEIRATAVGLCTGISRIGAAIGTWATPFALSTLGVGTTMIIAAAIALVGAVVGILMAPETNHQQLHESASLGN